MRYLARLFVLILVLSPLAVFSQSNYEVDEGKTTYKGGGLNPDAGKSETLPLEVKPSKSQETKSSSKPSTKKSTSSKPKKSGSATTVESPGQATTHKNQVIRSTPIAMPPNQRLDADGLKNAPAGQAREGRVYQVLQFQLMLIEEIWNENEY
jgi:hypothetical protein